jgi:arginine decarboxylase
LHVSGELICRSRVSQALRLVQSTSPSYLLLASLDAARQQMALHGQELMSKTIELAELARTQISQIEGLSVVKLDRPTPGFSYLDRTRLTVTVTGLDITGFAADEILSDELGITAELPSLQHLTFIISIGNTSADIDRLVAAFTELALDRRGDRSLNLPSVQPPDRILTEMAITPRQANRSTNIVVSINSAIGKISAESICPYPPGIPIIIAGEIITIEALDYLRQVLDFGGELVGCDDPTLQTIRVINL